MCMAKHSFLFLLATIAWLFTSCVDEDSELGLDIVDNTSRLSGAVYSGAELEAHTLRDNNLTTSSFRTGVLGGYQDPAFGTMATSLYAQLSFPNMPLDYSGGDYVLDSAVLTLAYSGQFSKQKQNKIRFIISELVESLNADSTYKAEDTKITGNVLYDQTQEISEEILARQRSDTTKGSCIRFVLDKEQMKRLLRKYTTNEEFQQTFKGIKIEAKPEDMSGGGVMLYLDFLSPLSHLTFHFQGREVRKSDQMIFGSKGARFIHVDYSFENAPLSIFNTNPNEAIDGKQKIYIGTLGCTQARFKISRLDSVQGKSINRATLILPITDDLQGYPNPPQKLAVFYYQHLSNGDSVLVPISDARVSSQHYGAQYDATRKEYRIRVTSHLQNYLNHKVKSPYIYIVADTRKSTANRVVISGPSATTKQAAIEIIFTR